MEHINRYLDEEWVNRFKRLAVFWLILPTAIASLALIGWAGNIQALRSISPNWPSMKFNTAICVLLLTYALTQLKATSTARRSSGQVVAIIVALVSSATLCQHLTGLDFGIDELFFRDPWALRAPGRMSGYTALCLLLFSVACLLALFRRHFPLSQLLAIAPLSGASAVLVGYLLSGEAIGRITAAGSMAFPTATSLTSLGLCFLGLTADQGIMRVFSTKLSGSLMLRRLFPLFSATSMIATGIVYKAVSLEILSRPLAGSILVITTLLILFFSMARSAHRNNQADAVKSHLLTDLQSYRARMTTMFEAIPQIVWSTDSNGKTDFFNSRWPEYVGAPRAGQEWISLVHPEERLACQAEWARSLGSGQPFSTTCRLEDRHGKYRWHLIRFLPIPEGADGKLKWLGTGTDIEEQRRAEEEKMLAVMREHAERERSEFTSNFLVEVSHEVRTPLSGVLGMADAIASTKLDPTQKDFLATLKASGRVLLELVNQVLDLHQIESGRMKLAESSFELRALLEEVIAENTPMATKKGLSLGATSLPTKELYLLGDRLRIRQVLTNLVANAVKFTDQGHVSVSVTVRPVHRGDKKLYFSVSDTGPGVTERANILDGNQGVENYSWREQRSFGLGLSICRKILRLMKSELKVESHSGQGSTFSFSLILPEAHPSQVAETSRQPEARELTLRKKVLLVEDQATNQKVVSFYLGKLGCSVDTAEDGEQALLKARTGFYDLVLMDCYMPKMDGYEATRALRALGGKWAHIPILALTANAVAGVKEACLQSGMNGYLTKPVTQDSLAEAMQLYLTGSNEDQPAESEAVDGRLDKNILDEIRALPTGRELLSDLVSSFSASSGTRLKAIDEAIRNGDAAAIRRECHALRSSAMYLGALEVQRICRLIEQGSDQEVTKIASEHVVGLARECEMAPRLALQTGLLES